MSALAFIRNTKRKPAVLFAGALAAGNLAGIFHTYSVDNIDSIKTYEAAMHAVSPFIMKGDLNVPRTMGEFCTGKLGYEKLSPRPQNITVAETPAGLQFQITARTATATRAEFVECAQNRLRMDRRLNYILFGVFTLAFGGLCGLGLDRRKPGERLSQPSPA